MLKLKVLTLFFALRNLLVPSFKERACSGFRFEKNGYKISRPVLMPNSVKESSGLEICSEGVSFWTLGDGGSKSQLFEVSDEGKVLSVLPLKGLRNQDWEDMAKDDEGNIYIGDFGNNLNVRRDLRIYKVNAQDPHIVDTISFRYPNQISFPPSRDEMNFDCESFFWYQDSLYLFSKNRGDRCMKIYRLPDKGGMYEASVHQEMYIDAQITSADISPDKKNVALLTYGKIYFLKVSPEEKMFRLAPCFKRKFNQGGQSEALVFINDTDMLVSNEQGQLFRVFVKKKKGHR